MTYANNNDTNQPARPRNLISVFVVRNHCIDIIKPVDSVFKISKLYPASAGLSFTSSKPPKTTLDMALIILVTAPNV